MPTETLTTLPTPDTLERFTRRMLDLLDDLSEGLARSVFQATQPKGASPSGITREHIGSLVAFGSDLRRCSRDFAKLADKLESATLLDLEMIRRAGEQGSIPQFDPAGLPNYERSGELTERAYHRYLEAASCA